MSTRHWRSKVDYTIGKGVPDESGGGRQGRGSGEKEVGILTFHKNSNSECKKGVLSRCQLSTGSLDVKTYFSFWKNLGLLLR